MAALHADGVGASTARLICQFVTEGLAIVAAGSVLGLVAAYWAMQMLTRLVPSNMAASMPFLQTLGFNYRVVGYAGVISLLAALLFTVTPLLCLSSTEMRDGMAEGSRGSAGNAWRRIGSKLVVLELATAMVLLFGAGLLGKSFYRLLQVDTGFQADQLSTLTVEAPRANYSRDEQAVALGRKVTEQLTRVPGVKSVALASRLPLSFNGSTDWIRFVGRPYNGEHNEVNQREVSAGYFSTLQARLLRGRQFDDSEDGTKPRVVIINQALVKKYFAVIFARQADWRYAAHARVNQGNYRRETISGKVRSTRKSGLRSIILSINIPTTVLSRRSDRAD